MEILREPRDGATFYIPDNMYPIHVEVVRERKNPVIIKGSMTVYGFVVNGAVSLKAGAIKLQLGPGGFFSIPSPLEDSSEISIQVDGFVVLIRREGFRGQLAVGIIERHGRLSYIDGCSDSLLVYPPRIGDPCLNHLHLPPGVIQTEHIHPSIRIGIIARGHGEARGRSSETGETWTESLEQGCVFLLPEHEVHAFRTDQSRGSLDVIAFHPDSDWGPNDDDHPMMNRTIFR